MKNKPLPGRELTGFDDLLARFRAMTPKRRVVVVCPTDEPTRAVVEQCAAEGSAEFLLTVEADKADMVRELADRHPGIEVFVADDIDAAATLGVQLVREGRGDVLMKGGINTDRLLRPVLNKEHGLLPPGQVLSHITLTKVPAYPKMLLFADAAVIPAPNDEQFRAMLRYTIDTEHALGNTCPRVALIHFTEKVNQKFEYTLTYADLIKEAAEGAFGECVVGGPMDVKTACDLHSAEIKGIDSPVAGKADVLIFPILTAANTFYKTVSFFCDAPMAGVLRGTTAPVVIPSRADHDISKLYSLALACLL
ncbi:MAG: phosphate butyryltransferase [Muribaculaceae bacterium]|nr:phosphate butyryltransferase [Muribaculaceae bacterium]